ncbi:MAG: hypothetical protein LIR46_07740 [Bacteroidota bacterium]|nr:hypothetical protein [Bacteroidota bacterium]
MTRGKYTRDFYFIPTILYHDGDGIYASIELAWLKWYIGFCWIRENEGRQKYEIGRYKGMQKALDIIKKYKERMEDDSKTTD